MSKKKYFINVSFSTSSFNKFAYSVVDVDIGADLINEIAKEMVRAACEKEGVDVNHVDINVTAFNRV